MCYPTSGTPHYTYQPKYNTSQPHIPDRLLPLYAFAVRCRFLSEGSIACLMGLVSALCLLAFHKYLVNGVISELLQFDSANFFM